MRGERPLWNRAKPKPVPSVTTHSRPSPEIRRAPARSRRSIRGPAGRTAREAVRRAEAVQAWVPDWAPSSPPRGGPRRGSPTDTRSNSPSGCDHRRQRVDQRVGIIVRRVDANLFADHLPVGSRRPALSRVPPISIASVRGPPDLLLLGIARGGNVHSIRPLPKLRNRCSGHCVPSRRSASAPVPSVRRSPWASRAAEASLEGRAARKPCRPLHLFSHRLFPCTAVT